MLSNSATRFRPADEQYEDMPHSAISTARQNHIIESVVWLTTRRRVHFDWILRRSCLTGGRSLLEKAERKEVEGDGGITLSLYDNFTFAFLFFF